jgi:hypothetical protein
MRIIGKVIKNDQARRASMQLIEELKDTWTVA